MKQQASVFPNKSELGTFLEPHDVSCGLEFGLPVTSGCVTPFMDLCKLELAVDGTGDK